MNLKFKNILLGLLYNFINHPLRSFNVRRYFWYIKSLILYINKGGSINNLYPIVVDYDSISGVNKGHYFHLDLIVASEIFNNNPNMHLDIGSRVDGFVAHVASFRKIYVFDIRNLDNQVYKNISYINIDIQNSDLSKFSFDSISSLHALEHFGLGRYGDSIDPDASYKSFLKLSNILCNGGYLYIGVPISNNPRIEFNAHRIFDPREIVLWGNKVNLKLTKFHAVLDDGSVIFDTDYNNINLVYGCGIFIFKKLIE